MIKAQNLFKCSSELCRIVLSDQSYYFQHASASCKRKLCFWCVLELYKKEVKNIDMKIPAKTKLRLKILMPCCKASQQNQFVNIESFIVSGCPFDGTKCSSKQKYFSSAGLWIGKDCLDYFYNNFKSTQRYKRFDERIQLHTNKKCRRCHLLKVLIIQPNFSNKGQYQRQLSLCQDCCIQECYEESRKTCQLKCCCECKEKQILEEANIIQDKKGQFIVKKFQLVHFLEDWKCCYCVYTKFWVNACENFENGKINFQGIMYCLSKVQTIFVDICLTCGNQPQKDSNVFQFKDLSIKSPYELLAFLCGHCYLLMVNSGKITKTMKKLQQYLHKTNQIYSQIKQSIKFKEFKEFAKQRVKFYVEMLQNKQWIQDYEKSYQLKMKQKLMKKELTGIQREKPQNIDASKKLQIPINSGQINSAEELKPQKQNNLPSKVKQEQIQKFPIKKQSKEIKESLELKKKITQTEQTKKKSEQLTKTQNNQNKPEIKSGNIFDKKTYGQINLEKRSTQPIKNQLKRTKDPKQQKNRRLIKRSTSDKIKSENSLNSKTQSINQSERSSITDLAESRQSWREQSSEFDVTAKEQQKPMQIEEFKHILHQKGQIYQNDTESLDDYEKKDFTQPLNSNQIHKFIEKSYPKEEECNSMESVEDQLQNQHITKQVSIHSDKKSSFNMTTPQSIEKSLGINSPPQNNCHLRNSETQKTYFFTHEQIDQNIFSIKLEEWKFQPSKLVKSPTNCIDFDKKLLQIVNDAQSHFPQILKSIKSQRQKDQIDVSDKRGNQEKRIQSKNESLRFSCKNCCQSQEEFLFLEKYCLRCFNLVILGKLEGEKGKVSKRA